MANLHDMVIFIDKHQYRTEAPSMTGAELRAIPSPPIGPQFDLYLEAPGGDDLLIMDNVTYQIKNGSHFFTAPSTINPG
jgi:hypothetical protein